MGRQEYCTQLDQHGSGQDRCGGACLASALLHYGWQSDPWGLTVQLSDRYGITGVGVTAPRLLDCAKQEGLTGEAWYSQDAAGVHLGQDHAVLCLLDNRYLVPHVYPALPGWNALHWLRLVQMVDDNTMMYVYDPLCYDREPGAPLYQGPCAYTAESLWYAIQASPTPEWGIAVWKP